jgi:hypothetical protein
MGVFILLLLVVSAGMLVATIVEALPLILISIVLAMIMRWLLIVINPHKAWPTGLLNALVVIVGLAACFNPLMGVGLAALFCAVKAVL